MLLLANMVVLAAGLGKKVVALDFDLEAPGLPYKLFPDGPTQGRRFGRLVARHLHRR